MKKYLLIALTIMALLVTPVLAQEEYDDMREFYNPNHYEFLLVSDIFEAEDGLLVVQGCFGNLGGGELDYYEEGFDEEEIFTLAFVAGAEIMLPPDVYEDPANIQPCEDPVQWFEDAKAVFEDPDFSFLASFSMNEAGELRHLGYVYLP